MNTLNTLLFSAILCFSLTSSNSQSSKFALSIGVGDYPTESGWQKLNAQNDVDLIKETLEKQGFPSNNIFTLKNSEATRKGIISAFENKLLKKATEGSTVVFHFSGHGQQVWDDDGDEIDGFDEALVPINSGLHFKKGENEGEQLLRDEDLGALLFQLRQKLGPDGHLLVLIDACHSGTATRGLGVSRGTNIIMADEAYINKQKKGVQDFPKLEGELKENSEDLAPMVSFFSSSAQQLSYEYRGDDDRRFGLMTYAFCKELTNIENTATYQGLFERVEMEISGFTTMQRPQSEGKLDQRVLGGAVTEAPVYFKTRKRMSSNLVVLDAGQLQGLNVGTELVFYPIDTRDTSAVEPIAKGVVDYAKALDCDVQLDRAVSKKEILGTWAFIRKMNYGALKASLRLKVNTPELEKILGGYFDQKDFIDLSKKDSDLVLEEEKGQLKLLTQKDRLLWEGKTFQSTEEDEFDALYESIKAYMRASFLRRLKVEDAKYAAEMTMKLLFENGKTGKVASSFKVNQKAILEIKNVGTQGFYFSVMDITPKDEIMVFIPYEKPANEYYLPPGKTYKFEEPVDIYEPVGQDVLKIITTPEPINLKKIQRTRGISTRNLSTISNPLEILYGDTFLDSKNTRGTTSEIPLGVGFVGGIVVTIEEN